MGCPSANNVSLIRQNNIRSAPFSWRNYFVGCWSTLKSIYPVVPPLTTLGPLKAMVSSVQPTAFSLPFGWPNYFVASWSHRLKSVYSVVYSAAHAFRYPKPFVFIRFRKLFEGWLLRKPGRKALLIGIRYDDDPGTETLAGPHQDVQSLKRLLISEWCLVCVC
jgi:hypothetical protein